MYDSILCIDLMSVDRPTATITTPPVVIETGSTLQLGCLATGAPAPMIVWSRNGMTFDPDDVRVSMAGGSLIVVNTTLNDSGDYQCIATSSAGTVSASLSVAVVTVSANASDIVTVRSASVILDCVDMLVVEAPLQWGFEGTVVILSDKYTVLENGSLLVRDVDVADMGVYECVVGDVVLTHSLQVQAAPFIIALTEGSCENPGSLSIDSDATLLLNCTAYGIPPPTVTLLFEGRELVSVLCEGVYCVRLCTV